MNYSNKSYKTKYSNRTGCSASSYSDIEQFLLSGMSLEEISRHVNMRLGKVRKVVQDILEQKKFLEKGIITLNWNKHEPDASRHNSKKGKGWHGEHQRHKEVAARAQTKHAQNTPMKKTPSYKPPYRVDVWEERDRLIITVYDKDDKEVASWVDEDARQMFEDGFFKSRDLEQSVLEYLRYVKIIKGGRGK